MNSIEKIKADALIDGCMLFIMTSINEVSLVEGMPKKAIKMGQLDCVNFPIWQKICNFF